MKGGSDPGTGNARPQGYRFRMPYLGAVIEKGIYAASGSTGVIVGHDRKRILHVQGTRTQDWASLFWVFMNAKVLA